MSPPSIAHFAEPARDFNTTSDARSRHLLRHLFPNLDVDVANWPWLGSDQECDVGKNGGRHGAIALRAGAGAPSLFSANE